MLPLRSAKMFVEGRRDVVVTKQCRVTLYLHVIRQ